MRVIQLQERFLHSVRAPEAHAHHYSQIQEDEERNLVSLWHCRDYGRESQETEWHGSGCCDQ